MLCPDLRVPWLLRRAAGFVDWNLVIMVEARTILGFRLPDDLPLVPVLERQYPLPAGISLEDRHRYRIGLDSSLNQQTGQAGFAGVALWPGFGAVHLFSHTWDGAMLSSGLTEATALLLALDWVSSHCTAPPSVVIDLHVEIDRDSVVANLVQGTTETWNQELHAKILDRISRLLQHQRIRITLTWESRETELLTLADAFAKRARGFAAEAGTSVPKGIRATLNRAADIYARDRPARRRPR